MSEKYKGKVEFLPVYIREAHPTTGGRSPPTNLGIKFNRYNVDNKVELNYAGWPDRLYLVGQDGRVAWKGGPRPQGFKPPVLDAAIENELKR